jgi:hypothetical protein
MIRRLALVSSLVVIAAVASTAKAQAESVDVQFNGTIPNSCTITKISDGNLYMVNNYVMDANDGGRAQVNVNCKSNGQVTIGDPVPTTPDASSYDSLSGTETVAELWNSSTGGGYLADSQGMFGSSSYTAVSNSTDVPLYINVFTRNGSVPLSVGTYGFQTTVTVNPL